MSDRMMTRREAWSYLGVSRSTLERLLAEGAIAYHRIGHGIRISESDLAAYLDNARVYRGRAAVMQTG